MSLWNKLKQLFRAKPEPIQEQVTEEQVTETAVEQPTADPEVRKSEHVHVYTFLRTDSKWIQVTDCWLRSTLVDNLWSQVDPTKLNTVFFRQDRQSFDEPMTVPTEQQPGQLLMVVTQP